MTLHSLDFTIADQTFMWANAIRIEVNAMTFRTARIGMTVISSTLATPTISTMPTDFTRI